MKQRSLKMWFVLLAMSFAPVALSQGYQKSTEGGDVVMNKLYDKEKKFELSLPNVGLILNQSYVNTFLINFGASYFFKEEWGFGADISLASNSDKEERNCIENFYNDPNDEVSSPCGGSAALDGTQYANYGPAYVPIREIQTIATANVIWNPVYGKQLVLMSATSYFDLFLEGGLSLVSSKFYPKQDVLRNGNRSRGTFNEDGSQPASPNGPLGAAVSDDGSYGKLGRPDPESQSNVAINLGVGQKFHFAKRFFLKTSLRNMTILGTQSGFENLFSLSVGAGMRF